MRPAAVFFVRYQFRESGRAAPASLAAVSSLLLHPLDPGEPVVRLDAFQSASAALAADGEAYELRIDVPGAWSSSPHYAVFADWQIDDPARAAAFEESRQQLFQLRRKYLPTFARDWLLKRLDLAGRYTVVGLYGDEEGIGSSRAHPKIQRFAQEHPPAQLGATDVSGLRFFRVILEPGPT